MSWPAEARARALYRGLFDPDPNAAGAQAYLEHADLPDLVAQEQKEELMGNVMLGATAAAGAAVGAVSGPLTGLGTVGLGMTRFMHHSREADRVDIKVGEAVVSNREQFPTSAEYNLYNHFHMGKDATVTDLLHKMSEGTITVNEDENTYTWTPDSDVSGLEPFTWSPEYGEKVMDEYASFFNYGAEQFAVRPIDMDDIPAFFGASPDDPVVAALNTMDISAVLDDAPSWIKQGFEHFEQI